MNDSAFAPTPRQAANFRRRDALMFDAVIRLARVAGLWRYPARASGDLEDMHFLDKAYWLFKSENPIRHGVRGAGIEAFFARQPPCSLPEAFTPLAEVTLSAVGDLMNHPYVSRSEALYSEVAELIFGADLAMANLECVVLASAGDLVFDPTGTRLAIEPDGFRRLVANGPRFYDVVATANNHSLDFGEEGVVTTIAALARERIAFHGTCERDDLADQPAIVERRGVRIGVVSHTFGLNARRPPAHRPRIVNHTKLNRPVDQIEFGPLQRQLAACRAAGADFVVAQLHWGMEFEFYPRPEQLEVAHRIAELGADAIVGHHPHVVQPLECYRTRRDPDRWVPIYYSLGNLTMPFGPAYTWRSGVARLDLIKGTDASGRTRTYVRTARLERVEQAIDPDARTIAIRPHVWTPR